MTTKGKLSSRTRTSKVHSSKSKPRPRVRDLHKARDYMRQDYDGSDNDDVED